MQLMDIININLSLMGILLEVTRTSMYWSPRPTNAFDWSIDSQGLHFGGYHTRHTYWMCTS